MKATSQHRRSRHHHHHYHLQDALLHRCRRPQGTIVGRCCVNLLIHLLLPDAITAFLVRSPVRQTQSWIRRTDAVASRFGMNGVEWTMMKLTTDPSSDENENDVITRAGTNKNNNSTTSTTGTTTSTTVTEVTPAVILNGKRVLPFAVLMGGLSSSSSSSNNKVAAVYACVDRSYTRGTDGWASVTYVGMTHDLQGTLQRHQKHLLQQQPDGGVDRIAHIRALTFAVPQLAAMQHVAQQWRDQATQAGAALDDVTDWASTDEILDYLFDDEDDDDDEEDEWDDVDLERMEPDSKTAIESSSTTSTVSISSGSPSEAVVVSPFQPTGSFSPINSSSLPSSTSNDPVLELTVEHVDRVLDEVRPYLISDGGNVAVEQVADGKVYLRLQGACGSCPSSTVTMQMGIERVLKEHFVDFQGVVQVIDGDGMGGPVTASSPIYQAVEKELNRMRMAITAMGGVVRLDHVDESTGLVRLEYQGAAKVRQGLELAIRDIPAVTDVTFV